MPTPNTSALAKLTPEEREKVIDLAARITLNKHLRGILDQRKAEEAEAATGQTSTSNDNPKQN